MSGISNETVSTIPSGKKLYRARLVNNDDIKSEKGIQVDDEGKTTGFNREYSIEPPLGKGTVGRNNLAGVSFLYLADKIETACAEIKPYAYDVISLAEFETQKPLKVFNLEAEYYGAEEKDDADICNELMWQFCRPIRNEKEYYHTNCIADHIRKAGFDGICYRSLFDSGINYTIFNSHEINVCFVKSRLLMTCIPRMSFWDYNTGKRISTYPSEAFKDENEQDNIISMIKNKLNK